MTPMLTPKTDRILGKPPGWDFDHTMPCDSLPVIEADGTFYSYWRATWRERLAIMFGRPVRLALVGAAHPPVMLDTIKE